ncbi:MAG: glycosyltransferase family 4 protein [Planctomycetota bacterium]
MRILHVNATADRAGGAEVFLHDLIDWSRAHGHAAALFAGHPERTADEPDLRILRRPEWSGASLISDPPFEAAAVDFVERFRPDLIHLHNLSSVPVGLITALAALDVPMVQHVHDASTLCANAWVVHPSGTVCEGGVGAKCLQHACGENYPFDGRILLAATLRARALERSVEGWIAASECYADLARRNGFDPVVAIPYWSPSPPIEPPPQRVGRRILFLGRLVPEKGVATLLEAWPRVLAAVPDAVLDLVGDGPQRPELEALAQRLGLDASIFSGKIPHHEVHARMQASSALVFPSIWLEAYGIISLEAFRAGLPVVASRIGGIPEVVTEGETGLLAPPRDAAALAEALIRVLTDDALHARLVAGCLAEAERRRDDAPMHAVFEQYERALQRGTEHRRAVDVDLLAGSDALLRDFERVERWALDMRGHIDYLEANGRATRPFWSFAKHVRARVRRRLGRDGRR